MNFAEYCCGGVLNMFWRYCPWCGNATTARLNDIAVEADNKIKIMTERHETLRSTDQGEERVGEVREESGGPASPPDKGPGWPSFG